MTPLGRYSIYCDHGIHVGSECWRCWQRRALDAEAALVALAKAASYVASYPGLDHWQALDEALAFPAVRKLLEAGVGIVRGDHHAATTQ